METLSKPMPMKNASCRILAAVFAGFVWAASTGAAALSLHPDNPHYFLFRGKPTIIITSGEHYGALLNLDFDYKKYLETLKKDHLNNTRVFSGVYCEPPGAFNITSNTLAPLPGRFISPWARSKKPGYANGGNKFNLEKWDRAYFRRLENLVSEANKRGIIVEMNLFCPFYEDSMWRLSPMNAANNVNNVGDIPRTNVYTLDKHGGLLPYQEELVRKIVRTLRLYDNVYYEIANEPYFGGITMEWQHRIADVIVETQRKVGRKHLISQNIANDKARVEDPHPAISIFNFHYATPPDTVEMNYGLNKVIGDNETGFRGTNDAPYRMEAWDFIAAGGGLFNHLDYSFVAGYEDGTFVYPASQPGGGNPNFRRQIRFLSDTMHTLRFIDMRPDNALVKTELPPGATVRTLANPGEHYLIYIRTGIGQRREGPELQRSFKNGELAVEVDLPPGEYTAEWLDTTACTVAHHAKITHVAGKRMIVAPGFEDDIALVIRKR